MTKKKTNVVSVPLTCVSAPNAVPGMTASTAKTHFGKTQDKTKSPIHGHAGTSRLGQMHGSLELALLPRWLDLQRTIPAMLTLGKLT